MGKSQQLYVESEQLASLDMTDVRRLLWSVVVILDEATAYTNRTYNMKSPYPEEFNRQAIGLIASLHFARLRKQRMHC